MYDTIVDYNTLVNDVMQTNAMYLTISVSIIIFIGGFIYLFNIKPYQEEIKESRKLLEKLTKDNEKLSESVSQSTLALEESLKTSKSILSKRLSNFENRFSELEAEIESMNDNMNLEVTKTKNQLAKLIDDSKKEIQDLKWEAEWNLHYVWDAKGVHYNTIGSLIRTIEYGIRSGEDYKITLPLEELLVCLENNIEELEKDEDWNGLKSEVSDMLNKIESDTELVSKIKKLLIA